MVKINGEYEEYIPNTKLTDILNQKEYTISHIAVEINYEMVPKSEYNSTIIKDNDEIEIVTFMGGGTFQMQ
jgi:sulfur carrier protein